MRETLSRCQVVDGFWLKVVALVTMTVDHTAAALNKMGQFGDWYWPMRYIGRAAFPIYCFLLVEGFRHTRSRWKYLLRLLALFAVSEPIYDLTLRGQLSDWSNQNVLLTLSLGLGTVWAMELAGEWLARRESRLSSLGAFLCLPGLWLAEVLRADYGYGGVLLIVVLYVLYRWPLCRSCVAFPVLCLSAGTVEKWAVFAFLLILLYSGERGRVQEGRVVQYAFYFWYPLHLTAILLLARMALNVML